MLLIGLYSEIKWIGRQPCAEESKYFPITYERSCCNFRIIAVSLKKKNCCWFVCLFVVAGFFFACWSHININFIVYVHMKRIEGRQKRSTKVVLNMHHDRRYFERKVHFPRWVFFFLSFFDTFASSSFVCIIRLFIYLYVCLFIYCFFLFHSHCARCECECVNSCVWLCVCVCPFERSRHTVEAIFKLSFFR